MHDFNAVIVSVVTVNRSSDVPTARQVVMVVNWASCRATE